MLDGHRREEGGGGAIDPQPINPPTLTASSTTTALTRADLSAGVVWLAAFTASSPLSAYHFLTALHRWSLPSRMFVIVVRMSFLTSTSGSGVVDVEVLLAAAGGSGFGSGASGTGWTATVLAPTEGVPNQGPSEGEACAAISESVAYYGAFLRRSTVRALRTLKD